MRLWCLSAPLYSHLDWGGFLKTALELQARGHDVRWVSETPVRGALEQAGIPFNAIEHSGWLWPPPPAPDLTGMPPQEAVLLRYRRALDTWLSEDLVAAAVDELIALAGQVGKPDVIAADPFLSAGALAAEALDVPLIVCGYPALRDLRADALFPVQRILADDGRERLARLLTRFGLAGRYFSGGAAPSVQSPLLHLSYFSPTWHQADTDNLLPQTRFVGGIPSAPQEPSPAWLTDIPLEAPVGVVTLGTTFTGDLGFFAWAAQALARCGIIPVVALGFNPISPDDKAALKTALPPATRLVNYVPFDHVLPRARILVHHGGMGTTHAALLHGVPQVIVPHAADQRGQARRAAQAKVGIELTAHDVKQGRLLEAVRAVANDPQVRANAAALAAEFAALGGAGRAADEIEKFEPQRDKEND